MLDFLVTLSLFNVAVLAVPFFVISYVFLKFSRALWLNSISFLHPDVEFLRYHTVRTLLDTHRNKGIISVLLSVKGMAQPEAVRRHLQEVVSRKDKTGNLAFPRLRHCLVTRCGQYAWQQGVFDLDQNVTLAPFTYKGRAVTEYNIQEYISEIVSKYLPANSPPWQVIIVPSSEDNHYILLKIHHVLLSEGLNIGDLLPLIPPTRQISGTFSSKSPLVEVYKKPEVIAILKEKLAEELSNRWNDFVSNYDPLERPELFKNTPTLPEFMAIILITLVSLFKECRKGFRVIKNDVFSKTKFVLLQTIKETNKRQVTFEVFFYSILATINPKNAAKIFVSNLWYFVVVLPVRTPIAIYAEFLALYSCLTTNYCMYPHTVVGILYTYIPLCYNSLKEILLMASSLFKAPKTIIQDILLQKESFQTITLCGRKSVAWSDSVKMDVVRSISKRTGASETEITLCAVASCLSKYFAQTGHKIPENGLPITIRNVNSNYVFATGQNVKPEDFISGIICLNLPLLDPDQDVTQTENLEEIKRTFNASLEKQGLSHLLTKLQTKYGILTKILPSAVASVYLKYLSRKYPVTVTEVTNRYPNVTQKTLWGQEVNSAIYWRPPQANTSISLCLNEYADHVKLAVMCDSQLVPSHQFLVMGFSEFVQDLNNATQQ